MTTFHADWICPVSSPTIAGGAISIENGRIAAIGAAPAGGDSIRFPGCAIIPGFVNAHTHIELTILRGFLEDLPFGTWIPRLTSAKYQFLSRDDMLLSARLGAAEMIAAGVTCLGEVMDLGTAWAAMNEFDLQGIAYQEVFGPAESDEPGALDGLRRKVAAYAPDQTQTRRIGVSPHAPYTVSGALFRSVYDYALREDLSLTTHIAESKEESEFIRNGSGPLAERLSARGIVVEGKGCSSIAYLDRLAVLGPEMLLVHAIAVDDADLETLRSKMPAIVHCPKSNAKLAHGIARVEEMRMAGLRVGLGTDSVASNNVIDMFEEMRFAVFQQRGRTGRLESLDAKTVFRMATLGGAECLGLSEHLGSLTPGTRADFVVVDLSDPAVQPIYDPIDAMVYSASRSNVRATYIGGREVRIDTGEMVRQIGPAASRLAQTFESM